MKTTAKIFGYVVLIITVISVAYGWAMTQEDFKGAILKDGIDKAVVAALAEGMSPDEIVRAALTVEGLNPRAVLVALCKAGVDDETLTNAGTSNDLALMVVTSACEECKKWSEAQPYTPAPVVTAAPIPGPTGGGTPAEPYYASPGTL